MDIEEEELTAEGKLSQGKQLILWENCPWDKVDKGSCGRKRPDVPKEIASVTG